MSFFVRHSTYPPIHHTTYPLKRHLTHPPVHHTTYPPEHHTTHPAMHHTTHPLIPSLPPRPRDIRWLDGAAQKKGRLWNSGAANRSIPAPRARAPSKPRKKSRRQPRTKKISKLGCLCWFHFSAVRSLANNSPEIHACLVRLYSYAELSPTFWLIENSQES